MIVQMSEGSREVKVSFRKGEMEKVKKIAERERNSVEELIEMTLVLALRLEKI